MLAFSPINNTYAVCLAIFMQKIIYTILSFIYLSFQFSSIAFAVTIPTFPSCAAPQGEIKASYSEGTHGIVGSGQTYTGSDTVYRLSDSALTQCFCDKNENGIQTNWWKVDGLLESDIDILRNEGWYYIPNGSLWGLTSAPYVAKNYTYTCLPGSALGSTQELGTGTGGGDGDILGLAATGNTLLIVLALSFGIGLFLFGLVKLVKDSQGVKNS